jgi:hypothetical protein
LSACSAKRAMTGPESARWRKFSAVSLTT